MAEIEAGRETDARVARMMGWTECEWTGWEWLGTTPDGTTDFPIEPYSTDIAAAMQVVEKMQADGFDFILEFEHADGNEWEAEFFESDNLSASTRQRADTAPLAICKAALQAVGYSPVERETAGT